MNGWMDGRIVGVDGQMGGWMVGEMHRVPTLRNSFS